MEDKNTEEGLPAEAGAAAGEGNNGGMVGKIIGLVVVVVVIALGVYALTRGSQDGDDGITPEAASTQNEEAAATAAQENTEATAPVPVPGSTVPEAVVEPTGQVTIIAYTDDGYSPKDVTVKKGDTVMFKNESANPTWPASAMHPTHTVYPGSDIQKCGTPEASKIFDACRGLNTGDTWSFQFGEVGKWNYHDHLNAGNFGSITVTE